MNNNIKLPLALAAWRKDNFTKVLKQEIDAHGADSLGLNHYATGFYSTTHQISTMVLGATDKKDTIEARLIILSTVTEETYNCPVGIDTHTTHYQQEGTVLLDKTNATAVFHLSPAAGPNTGI